VEELDWGEERGSEESPELVGFGGEIVVLPEGGVEMGEEERPDCSVEVCVFEFFSLISVFVFFCVIFLPCPFSSSFALFLLTFKLLAFSISFFLFHRYLLVFCCS